MNAILLAYQSRILALHAAAGHLRTSQTVAIVLMSAAFLAILTLGSLSIARRSLPLISAPIPLPIAIYFGRLGKLRNRKLLQTLRLETYYRNGVLRLTDKWAGSGVSGDEFAPANHSFARDLNVFGAGSVFELLCTCRTEIGRRQLASYVLETPTLAEAAGRQEAVKELQNNTRLREDLQLLGEFSFQQTTWSTISDWLNSPAISVPVYFRAAAFIASLSLVILFLLGLASIVAWSHLTIWLAASLLLNALLGFVYRERLLTSIPAMLALASELSVFRQGLQLLREQKFQSAKLANLTETAALGDIPTRLQYLERLINFFSERDKEWFYAVSRALLLGTHVFFSIEKWRSQNTHLLRQCLKAWGEFEALMAISTYAYEHPENCFPEFTDEAAMFTSQALCHPLLPVDSCVANDISLGEPQRFYIVSGSNMSGKSTLLRAIGLNLLLAYAGAPVRAGRLLLSRLSVCASITVEDSLLQGKSRFFAEIERLRVALSPDKSPVLFLIDEILAGTNSVDRRIASEAILRELIRQNAVGVLTTHDLALTELAALPELHGVNVHMGSRDTSDPLNFDYRLKSGVSRESSALAIARLVGVPL